MTEEQPEVPASDENPAENSTGEPSQPDSFEQYQNVAETVGMIPSLRKKDNLIQGLVVLVCGIVGALVGGLLWGLRGAGGLALVGLALGTLVSGFILMILGWKRASK